MNWVGRYVTIIMKKIPEFEDYSITSDGRIYSHFVHRYLKPWANSGLMIIKLRKNDKVYKRNVEDLLRKTYSLQHQQRKGFKFIPGFEDYSINKDGSVYSHISNKLIRPFTVSMGTCARTACRRSAKPSRPARHLPKSGIFTRTAIGFTTRISR